MGEGVGVMAVVWEELCELERRADLEAGELVAGLDELVGVEMRVCAIVVDEHGLAAALPVIACLIACLIGAFDGGGTRGRGGLAGALLGALCRSRGRGGGREDGLPLAGGGVEEDVAEDGPVAGGALLGGAMVPDAEAAVGLFDEEEAVVAVVLGAVGGEAGACLAALIALDAPGPSLVVVIWGRIIEVGLVGEDGDVVACGLEEGLEDDEAKREVLLALGGGDGAVALARE